MMMLGKVPFPGNHRRSELVLGEGSMRAEIINRCLSTLLLTTAASRDARYRDTFVLV